MSNLDELKNYVDLIIKIRDSDDIQKIKEFSNERYENFMRKTFPIFENNYTTLFKLIINNADLKYLDYMIEKIKEMNKGKDKNTVEKELGETLAKEYVYPHIKKKK
tara:strand:- start:4495 stop:4812 length:318 start_codon:yes stop_codon:yes gene_type:complete